MKMFSSNKFLRILMFILTVCTSQVYLKKPRITCVYNHKAFERPSIGFYNTEKIPDDQCTHLIYKSIGIDKKGWVVEVKEDWTDLQNNGFRNFTNLKQKLADVKVLISLKAKRKFSDMVSKKVRRSTLIESLIEFIKYYGFDGVDLVWEFPGKTYASDYNRASDKTNYLYFVEELRRAFNEENKSWEITIFAPIYSTYVNEGFYIYELCKLVDAVHLKAFNLRTKRNYTDVFSPLYKSQRYQGDPQDAVNVNDGSQIWIDGNCPRHKLIIGIAFFGQSFRLLDNNYHSLGAPTTKKTVLGDYTSDHKFLSYYEICSSLLENSGWRRDWDRKGKVPYMYKDDVWISYEDEVSIQIKMDWIRSKQFGGVYAFSLDFDDFLGLCGTINPLINSLRANLLYYDVPVSNIQTTPLPPWLQAPRTPPTK